MSSMFRYYKVTREPDVDISIQTGETVLIERPIYEEIDRDEAMRLARNFSHKRPCGYQLAIRLNKPVANEYTNRKFCYYDERKGKLFCDDLPF